MTNETVTWMVLELVPMARRLPESTHDTAVVRNCSEVRSACDCGDRGVDEDKWLCGNE